MPKSIFASIFVDHFEVLMSSTPQAIIIGAGPAGLTAAYELLKRTDIQPLVFEMTQDLGGISKTVNYKGNRIDIGGHRFFSKSDRVMNWWLDIMPLEALPEHEVAITYHGKKKTVESSSKPADPKSTDTVMLVRNRISRIFYMRKFFEYPLKLSLATFSKLGFFRICRIGWSYAMARLFPIKKEKSLEDFFINRFGDRLYRTFFKDYTEKVWGVKCSEIEPEWGAQRIKGLSITKALAHAWNALWKKDKADLSQKKLETSLIERFMYPKLGPGQMWEEVAQQIEAKGGKIYKGFKAVQVQTEGKNVVSVTFENVETGELSTVKGAYFFSTMPVKDLISAMGSVVPTQIQHIAQNLMYRDFITVGVLLKKFSIGSEGTAMVPDNWIYIQEKDVKVGRLQVFNNWSPYLVADKDTVWIGLEYFCYEGDEIWSLSDEKMKALAVEELLKMNMILKEDVLDATVIKMPKTYPAYFGSYGQFDDVKTYVNRFQNLFLIGRNGMHKYNNQDHSMLTAMVAVDNIAQGIKDKTNLWAINTEEEYHESK